jgi:hypothetical protein
MASEPERRVSVGEEWDENFDVNFLELRQHEVRRTPQRVEKLLRALF